MKQYCRYCSHCIQGDCFYCTVFDMELTEQRIKQLNKCKEFNLCELGDVESGRQYKPRKLREPSIELPQITFEELERNYENT